MDKCFSIKIKGFGVAAKYVLLGPDFLLVRLVHMISFLYRDTFSLRIYIINQIISVIVISPIMTSF